MRSLKRLAILLAVGSLPNLDAQSQPAEKRTLQKTDKAESKKSLDGIDKSESKKKLGSPESSSKGLVDPCKKDPKECPPPPKGG